MRTFFGTFALASLATVALASASALAGGTGNCTNLTGRYRLTGCKATNAGMIEISGQRIAVGEVAEWVVSQHGCDSIEITVVPNASALDPSPYTIDVPSQRSGEKVAFEGLEVVGKWHNWSVVGAGPAQLFPYWRYTSEKWMLAIGDRADDILYQGEDKTVAFGFAKPMRSKVETECLLIRE